MDDIIQYFYTTLNSIPGVLLIAAGVLVLQGLGLTLRELTAADAPSLHAQVTTDQVTRFISPPPASVAGFERFIAWTHRERAAGRYACFAVVPAGETLAVGLFQIRWLEGEAGLGDVGATLEADGEALSEIPSAGFDAAVSRVGLIYFPDQNQALSEMCRVVRPGGRISSVVYDSADRNGFFALPVGIIRRVAGLPAPAPGLPGPFSLSGPGVAQAAYERAGIVDVTVTAVDSPVRLDSAAECVRFEQESFGALHQMLAGVDESARSAAWTEVREALDQFDGPSGFVGPCQMLVVSGTRP